ncbi:hypothetical protein RKD49_001113 [Streptomyces glaucescens]
MYTRILTIRTQPDEGARVFGGAPPVARIAPGAILAPHPED